MIETKKHILLGAGGSISKCLTTELLANKQAVKWASRRAAEYPGVESCRTDLLDPVAVMDAVEADATVYLLAGLKYNLAVWRDQWPRIMKNVIGACEAKRARLVFLDNVYMYGKVDGPMTESSPVRPSSGKGEVRKAIAQSLLSAVGAGRLRALIARSADFYGPFAEAASALDMMVLARHAKGRSAIWVGNPKAKHAFTFTPDIGKALWMLGSDENAYGQVWHLPTAPAMSGREFVDLSARSAGVKASSFSMARWMFRAAGLFDPMMGELVEMFYQFDSDYEFDSSKFSGHFSQSGLPTPYETGVDATIRYLKGIWPLSGLIF